MNRIQEILIEQGRSQKWLAGKLGFTTQRVGYYCRNQAQPSLYISKDIATALNVSINELIQEK